jgi:hypothetical protein
LLALLLYVQRKTVPERFITLRLLQTDANDAVAYFSINARIVNLVGGAGNNFCILGIPLRKDETKNDISLLVPSTSQPLYVSEKFEVSSFTPPHPPLLLL